ncbi:MAG: MATE family efflux transporter [Rhodobacteraceae bacterium]|nr:MATE family efflux transporter [Paracoccaceae bacterium]
MERQAKSYGAHAWAILAIGLPMIGSHLAQFAVHVMDTLMMGWYDIQALAAMVLGGTFFFVLFIMGTGYSGAVMPVVASAEAAGDRTEVRRATRMAMWNSILFGALAVPLMLAGAPILRAMGQEPELAALAGDYLWIAGWGIFPALLVMVLKSYLGALERMQAVLWITVTAAVLNGVLNYALIFGAWGAPELGIRGAAIASVIMQSASLVVLAFYASWAEPQHALFSHFWRPDWEAFRRIFALGWPIGITSLAEVGMFSATAVMMGWVGTIELAAHGIAIQIASAAFLVHLGLANAATVRAGQAHGRRNEVELRRAGLVATGMSLVIAVLSIVLFLTVPEAMLGIFLDPDDPARPEVIAAGVGLLAVAALFQLADAGQVMALGLLRGVQDMRVPMIYAALSYWLIGIPLCYILGFPLGYGGEGIWMGLVIGLLAAWLLMLTRFWRNTAWFVGGGTVSA